MPSGSCKTSARGKQAAVSPSRMPCHSGKVPWHSGRVENGIAGKQVYCRFSLELCEMELASPSVYGALPTSIWGRMCPTRPNRLRLQGASSLDNIAYFGVGNYCASQIHHRKPQSQQATTAAGKSTIIPPFWIRPSHLNWEEQKQFTTGRSQPATATSLYLSDPHSTYTT